MIKELGGAHGEFCDDGTKEPLPRLRRPWPVLKLITGHEAVERQRQGTSDGRAAPAFGILDEGSDHDGVYENLSDSEEDEQEIKSIYGDTLAVEDHVMHEGVTATVGK
jgi:hypothetical protein